MSRSFFPLLASTAALPAKASSAVHVYWCSHCAALTRQLRCAHIVLLPSSHLSFSNAIPYMAIFLVAAISCAVAVVVLGAFVQRLL